MKRKQTLELPTSGDSTRARYLERAYVRDDTNETMGLRGHQAYESLVARIAMVYDHLKILIYDRAAQGWYPFSTPKEQPSSFSQCWMLGLCQGPCRSFCSEESENYKCWYNNYLVDTLTTVSRQTSEVVPKMLKF